MFVRLIKRLLTDIHRCGGNSNDKALRHSCGMMMLTHGHRSPHAVVTPYDEMSQSVAHSFAPERSEHIHPLRQTAHVGSIAFVLPRGYDVAL